MIDFRCPKCKEPMNSPDSMAGQEETCLNCGNVAVVPNTPPPIPVRAAPIQQAPPLPPNYILPQVRLEVNVKGIKSTSGLGIASLVLGILAAITCWIPFVGMLGLPLAVIGIIFGGIGFLLALTGKQSGVGMPVSGCIVCVVSIIIAVASTGGTAAAISESHKKAFEPKNTLMLDDAKKAYVNNVLLNNVEVGKSVLDEKGVFGEVKNTGNRTLKKVEIVIYCLDRSGKEIFDKKYHPVLASDSGFSLGDNQPLKPNYSTKFGCKLDDAPSEWSGQVRVVVTNIEFAD